MTLSCAGEHPQQTPGLCVLCCRATTQQLYYDIMYDEQPLPGTIQRYGNLHSQALPAVLSVDMICG